MGEGQGTRAWVLPLGKGIKGNTRHTVLGLVCVPCTCANLRGSIAWDMGEGGHGGRRTPSREHEAKASVNLHMNFQAGSKNQDCLRRDREARAQAMVAEGAVNGLGWSRLD